LAFRKLSWDLKKDILEKRSDSRRLRIGHDRNMDYPLLSQKVKESQSRLSAKEVERPNGVKLDNEKQLVRKNVNQKVYAV
jgi:hypothetical protein